MAERKISTRLAIEGESQFKTALQNCNTEIKTMKSELALVQSEYQGSANSMQALTAKGEALGRMYDAQKSKVDTLRAALDNAQKAQSTHASAADQYKSKISATEQELQRLKDSTGDTSEEQRALTQELKKLASGLSDAEAKEKSAASGVQGWQKQLNYAQRDLNDLSAEVELNNKYVREAEKSFLNTASSIDEFGNKTDESASAVDTLATSLAAAGVTAGLREIGRALRECVDASVAFESAITGVYKTVDGTDAQLRNISDGIKQMSTEIPAGTKEIASVAEAAGQLGIATDDVLSFTRTMIDLGESTNLSADEAASSLAKFANITGTSADDYNRLGSVIVGLGNNFATTEADIVAMSTRLASAGTLAGMSETEIMALSTAMSSVGIEAEAGGTAMTQTLTAIESAVAKGGDGLEQFARISGVSAQEFSKLWGTSAITAVQKFIAGLGQLGDKGESATLVLDDMGLSGVRQSSMLKSLALASDKLSGAVDLSNLAWEENTALTDEAGKRYATTESRLAMCGNAAENLKASIGDVLTPALNELADTGIDGFQWAADFIDQNPWIIQALTAALAGTVALTAGVTAYTVSVKLASIATGAFQKILDKNPLFLVATAAVAAAAAFATLAMTNDDGAKSYRDMTEASHDAKKAINESGKAFESANASAAASADVAAGYVKRLDELRSGGLHTAEAQLEYANTVKKLQSIYPDLNLAIDQNTGLLTTNTQVLLDNIEAQKEAAINAAFQEQQNDLLEQQAMVEVEIATNKSDLNSLREQENALVSENNALNEQNRLINEELASLGADDVSRREELNAQLYASNDAMNQNTDAIVRLQDEQDILNAAISEGTDISAELSDELDRSKDAQQSLRDSLEETVSGAEDLNAEQKEAIKVAEDAYDAYVTLYDETKKAASESIDKQISQWEKMDNTAKTSAATVQEALQSQITYMQNYSNNLQGLANRNIEGVDRLVASLSDGSAESAAILAGLSGATDKEIEQIVASMGDVDKGKEAMADAIAGADEGVKTAMDKAVAAANRRDDMVKSGEDSAQGLIDGLNSKITQIAASGSAAGKAYWAAYKKEQKQNSPSKRMFAIGSDTVQGLIDGFESRENDLKEQAKKAADLLKDQFEDNDEAKELIDEYMDYYEQSFENTTTNAKVFADATRDQLDAIEEAWDDAAKKQEEMSSKLSGYGDLFKEKDGRYSVENLDEQISTLNQYEEVLNRLRDEKGIPKELLNEIVSMDVDDAIGYGEKLLGMGDTQFDDYVLKWEEKQKRAKEIADSFYKNEFEALGAEYSNTLALGLEELNAIGFDSGIGFAQYLMEGMLDQKDELMQEAQKMASDIKRVIDSALNSSGSSSQKNGSHALGIDYVPFDGYIAELHKGERVLTASEAQAYIDANTPSSFDIPTVRSTSDQQAAALVNAIGTLTAGVAEQRTGNDSATIILQTENGVEVARWLLPSIREVAAQSPEVERDF